MKPRSELNNMLLSQLQQGGLTNPDWPVLFPEKFSLDSYFTDAEVKIMKAQATAQKINWWRRVRGKVQKCKICGSEHIVYLGGLDYFFRDDNLECQDFEFCYDCLYTKMWGPYIRMPEPLDY